MLGAATGRRPLSGPQRVCVITGANAGIGKYTAIGLAQDPDLRVVMVARNEARGRAALAEVQQLTGRDDIVLVLGDLATVSTTNALADTLLERCPTIDLLINNAGVWLTKRRENADGFEATFATNHMAPFLLTLRLIERLRQSPGARIVNLSSALHRRGEVQLDDLHTRRRRYSGIQAYSDSKLMNLLFTRSLARRLELEGAGVTANAVHPGRVRTDISMKGEGVVGFLAKVFTPLVSPWLLTAEQGAATSIHVATSDEGGRVSGHYFARSQQTAPRPRALDDALGERLWSVSEELAGLTWPA